MYRVRSPLTTRFRERRAQLRTPTLRHARAPRDPPQPALVVGHHHTLKGYCFDSDRATCLA